MSGDDPDSGPDTDSGSGPDTNSDSDVAPTADSASSSGDRRGPLADLAEDVDARRDRSGEDVFEAAFAEQSFEEVDDDTVWADDGDDESKFGAVGEVIEAGERTYVVSKRNFCERCRHFSDPPDVRCTHEGTEIREFVDMDHVRLYSCPIVEERGLETEGPIE